METLFVNFQGAASTRLPLGLVPSPNTTEKVG